MQLTKGGNAPLPVPQVRLEFAWQARVGLDVSALLLDSTGKVRGDGDFVFFNQPQAENGAVRLSTGPQMASVEVDLNRLSPQVERIELTSSIDAALAGGTFSAVRQCRA